MVDNLLLSRARRLLLDTNAFIYFLAGLEPYLDILMPVFRRVQRGELAVLVSVVTEAELLIRPKRNGDAEAEERIRDLLSEDGFSVVSLDRQMARLAAELRARHDLGLSDAIIVATAIATGCEGVVSNDGKWRRVTEIAFVHLAEVASGK